MKNNLVSRLVTLLGFICLSQNIYSQVSQITTYSNTRISDNINGFCVYTPVDYGKRNKHYPIMIFCHGLGELGNGAYPFGGVTLNGPLKEIRTNSVIPGLNDEFIIIAPQFIGWPSPRDIDSTISYAKKNFRGRGKTFLTGLSMGGGAVWDASITKTSLQLSAIAPVCGAGNAYGSDIRSIAGNNLPVWAFHGTADNVVTPQSSILYVEKINGFVPTPNPQAKLTLFPGVYHDSWVQAYSGHQENGKNVYQWMLGYDKSLTQTISGFTPIANKAIGDLFYLNASSSSGLPVSYFATTTSGSGKVSISGKAVLCTGGGVVTITAFQDGNSNYKAAADMSLTFTIGGSVASQAINGLPGSSITYGSAPIVLTGGNSGNPVNVNYVSDPSTGVVSVNNSTINIVGPGTVNIVATQAGNSSFSACTTTGTFTILRKPASIATKSFSKTYGTDNPNFTGTVSGLVNGDQIDVTYSTSANSSSTVGMYNIYPAVSGTVAAKYEFSTTSGVLTIDKANLTLTGFNKSKTTAQPDPTFDGSISGLVNGDNFDVSYYSTHNNLVGYYPIVPSISGTAFNNYNVTLISGTLTIHNDVLYPLTISAFNEYKTYGEPNPIFTGTIVGLQNGHSVQVAYLCNPTGAGTFSISPSVSGLDLLNYDLTIVPGIFTVNKAQMTVTGNNYWVEYKNTIPALSGNVLGAVNGDVIVPSYKSDPLPLNVGLYAVVPSVSGSALSNYNIHVVNGSLTIYKAPLTVTAFSFQKQYGQANPNFTGNLTGVKIGDNISASYVCDHSGVGTFPILPVLSGNGLGNYDVTTISGIFTVSKGALTVTSNNLTSVYGQPQPLLSGTVQGKAPTDVINTYYYTAPVNGPGNYPVYVSVSGTALSNYTVKTVLGMLAVSKGNLLAIAYNATKTYGQPNPIFLGTLTGVASGDVLSLSFTTNANSAGTSIITPIVTGSSLFKYSITTLPGTLSIYKATMIVTAANSNIVYGDQITNLTGSINGLIGSDVINVKYLANYNGSGLFPIIPSVSGSSMNNYVITTIVGTLTVDKKPLTVSANNASIVYGDNIATLTGSISGLVFGEQVNASYYSQPNGVGNFPIVPVVSGIKLSNYDLTTLSGILNVQKKGLLIKADNKIVIMGEIPNYTYTTVGLVPNDEIQAILTSEFSAPGVYPIQVIASGADLQNYNLSVQNGIVTVGSNVITITAANASKTYGEPDPQFQSTVSGIINGDVIDLNYETDQNGAGNFNIIPVPKGLISNKQSLPIEPKYVIVAIPGKLTVNKANLVVTATDMTKKYGEADPIFVATKEGFVQGDDVAVNLRCPNSGIGTFQIVPVLSGASLFNYNLITMTGTLTVEKAPLRVYSKSMVKFYGTPNPVFTGSTSGLVFGEKINTAYYSNATAQSGIGKYEIIGSVSGQYLSNYDVTFVNGLLEVKKAPQEIGNFGPFEDVSLRNTLEMTLNGTVTSGLPITYKYTGPCQLSGKLLRFTGPGTVTLTASQNGNFNYEAASEVTYSFKVSDGVTSLEDTDDHETKYEIYPIPAKDMIYINGASGSVITVYNVLGELVISKNYVSGLDVSDLASGMYTLKIISGENTISKKIIVEK